MQIIEATEVLFSSLSHSLEHSPCQPSKAKELKHFQKRARALLGKTLILPRQGHTLSTLLTLRSLSRTEHTCIFFIFLFFYFYFLFLFFIFFLSFALFWRTPRSGLRAL